MPYISKATQLVETLLDNGQRDQFEGGDDWEGKLNSMYKGNQDKKGAKVNGAEEDYDHDDSVQIIDPQTRAQSGEIKKENEIDFVEMVRDLGYS